jgi:hypothetical protein
MKERLALLFILLALPTIALVAPSPIVADTATSSLPTAAQALMQALAPPTPTASVPPQASTTAAQALLQVLTPPAPIAPTSANVPPAARAVAATFTRPLVISSHGNDVSALQTMLKSQGYFSGNVTGYFGSLTALALKQFQTAHGIEALCGVGPKTRSLLNSLFVTSTDKAALIASLWAQVKALQAQIAALLAAQAASSTPSLTGGAGAASTAGSPATISNYTPPPSGGGGGGSSTPPANTTPPSVTVTSPTVNLAAGTTQTTLSVTTNENATCAYSTNTSAAFSAMAKFTTTGATSHTTAISNLTNGSSNTYYVKCQDTAGNVSGNASVTFSVALAPDTTPPTTPTGLTASAISSSQERVHRPYASFADELDMAES